MDVWSHMPFTDCKQTSIHAYLHSTRLSLFVRGGRAAPTYLHSTRRIDALATRDISFFIIHPQHSLSGLSRQHIHYVHIPALLHSSNPLTGRTGRLHICQTLVPSYRAQVFT